MDERTKNALDFFCGAFPLSGHELDEERFRQVIVYAFLSWERKIRDEIMERLQDAKNENWQPIFWDKDLQKQMTIYDHGFDVLTTYERIRG